MAGRWAPTSGAVVGGARGWAGLTVNWQVGRHAQLFGACWKREQEWAPAPRLATLPCCSHLRGIADTRWHTPPLLRPLSPWLPWPDCAIAPYFRSIADILLFDIVDLHTRIWGEEFRATWPSLAALHDK